MNKDVQDAVNDQVKHELASAYAYLSMSAHFESENLPGFARWMRLQAQEELGHAMRLFDYLNERGARVMLQAVEKPPTNFDSPLSVFEQALAHEKKITGLIEQLYETAGKHRDYATQVALQWFLTEQVEEENSVSLVVEQVRMAGENRAALLMLDRALGARAGAD
ncbi:ferritin [soil metagenome]